MRHIADGVESVRTIRTASWGRGSIGTETRGEREIGVGMDPLVSSWCISWKTQIGVGQMSKLAVATMRATLTLSDKIETCRTTFERRGAGYVEPGVKQTQPFVGSEPAP
jgi:hypothetical protein